MHLISSILLTEGTICVCGLAAMVYWRWKAVPDPSELQFEGDFPKEGTLSPVTRPVESRRYCLIKRGIDFTTSFLLLIVFAVPGCLIAALIWLTSDGPIFYTEKRIGQYGCPFRIWKFRSMYTDREIRSKMPQVESGEAHRFQRMRKSESDPRITKIGHFLRRWSVDEVPQLLNVIVGDMSLIGPRPIVEAEIELYGEKIDRYVEVKPGLSGLWQVSGRSNVGYEKRAELDAHYVHTWSLKSDFQILARTVPAVLKRVGAK
jgi:lipopolysaccharide/colanic/teichoic acid biosynthesis glycosyltransferase